MASICDSLKHDDRLESLAGAVARYAANLGVDPETVAKRATSDRLDEELERLHAEADDIGGYGLGNSARNDPKNGRSGALSPSKR